jgi:protein O-GlcNAc transferase
MATLSEAFATAVAHHQAGRLDLAAEIYRRILAVEPHHAHTLHLLGVIAHQTGQHAVAVDHIRRAIALFAGDASFYHNLGEAYRGLRKNSEALAAYRRALELDPAVPETHNGLGLVLQAEGQTAEALACFERALRLRPNYAEAVNNRAMVWNDQGRLDEAAAEFRRAQQLDPRLPAAFSNLGTILHQQRKIEEAVACYQRALELNPEIAETYCNLAAALQEQGSLDAARAACQRSLQLRPGYAEALVNLGGVYKDQGQLVEAIAISRQAVECRPDFAGAYSNVLYTMLYSADYDAQQILAEHRRWNERYAAPLAAAVRPHANDRSPDRRLRIGYISPNFRAHPLALIAGPLFRAHDHQQFTIYCYSDLPAPDATTAFLRGCADAWREIVGRPDDEVAELVRADQIDILVDMTMHMAHQRLLVFARKPAPVQVTWFAYPGTTGVSAIDYRLTDPYLDPPGLTDGDYTEQSIRLPDTFWCYDPGTTAVEVGPLPALAKGYVTFGCLNNFCKITPVVRRLWAAVLRELPDARLLLLAKEGSHRQALLDAMQAEGVAAERVSFVGMRPRDDYLRLYHQIDVGLDTLPYNGHTTSLDSFWMGVPVVTLAGQTVVGRAGVSQLTNLGLAELAAQTPAQFVAIAAGLARDLRRLAELRATLRGRMEKSPLMDGPRFARNIEAAYRTMWRRWCAT